MSKQQQQRPHPLAVIRRARELGIARVLVSFSMGKDSLAALELCCEHFGPENVSAFWMFIVPDLSFQTKYLGYIERRHGITIHRLPHYNLPRMYRNCAFRHGTTKSLSLRLMRRHHVEDYARQITGIDFIATGEKRADSIERNAQIRKHGGINSDRRLVWPVGFWLDSQVHSYLESRRVPMPPDYRLKANARSFSGLLPKSEITLIREHYPEDYERIRKFFPMIEGYSRTDHQREIPSG